MVFVPAPLSPPPSLFWPFKPSSFNVCEIRPTRCAVWSCCTKTKLIKQVIIRRISAPIGHKPKSNEVFLFPKEGSGFGWCIDSVYIWLCPSGSKWVREPDLIDGQTLENWWGFHNPSKFLSHYWGRLSHQSPLFWVSCLIVATASIVRVPFQSQAPPSFKVLVMGQTNKGRMIEPL